MKVLMATDGSGHAITAINSAGCFLRKDDLTADVLSVEPEFATSGVPSKARLAYSARVRNQTRWITRAAVEVLKKEKINANTIIESGSPAEEILKAATDYDIVVVGAHGRHERKQPGLGPISSQVVLNASASVFVGRELSSESTYRVLVALDGSANSFEALRRLNAYFDVSAFDITLMHVVELPWTRMSQTNFSIEDADAVGVLGYQAQIQHELRRQAEEIIDRGLFQLEQWQVAATTIIEEGEPALEITSHAEEGDYDLIVAAATGSSDMKHALLGSVSHKLAWNAPCSVLVVRT
ncbi:MAG: universal stress protein [Acidobacteria bacterium]|nr:universal stress protein [Acidobacteriota bacterium]